MPDYQTNAVIAGVSNIAQNILAALYQRAKEEKAQQQEAEAANIYGGVQGEMTPEAFADLQARLGNNPYSRPYLNAAQTRLGAVQDREREKQGAEKEKKQSAAMVNRELVNTLERTNDLNPEAAQQVFEAMVSGQPLPSFIESQQYREVPGKGPVQMDPGGRPIFPEPETESFIEKKSVWTPKPEKQGTQELRTMYDENGNPGTYWVDKRTQQVTPAEGVGTLVNPKKSAGKGGGRGAKGLTASQKKQILEAESGVKQAERDLLELRNKEKEFSQGKMRVEMGVDPKTGRARRVDQNAVKQMIEQKRKEAAQRREKVNNLKSAYGGTTSQESGQKRGF